jgi:hypothetical protein
MYFVFVYENETMKLVEIVRWEDDRRVNLRYITITPVNVIMYPPAQL